MSRQGSVCWSPCYADSVTLSILLWVPWSYNAMECFIANLTTAPDIGCGGDGALNCEPNALSPEFYSAHPWMLPQRLYWYWFIKSILSAEHRKSISHLLGDMHKTDVLWVLLTLHVKTFLMHLKWRVLFSFSINVRHEQLKDWIDCWFWILCWPIRPENSACCLSMSW
jgi:hypothetical protein